VVDATRYFLLPTAVICLATLLGASTPSSLLAGTPVPRVLTFDERVSAERAIEQVYWNHRIWPKDNPGPKPPLATVMSEDVIRLRVEEYLKESNALGRWGRPITAEQLQIEIDRIAAGSRDPQVLSELFAALGHDPLLIVETLARPALADRLVRNRYESDAGRRRTFETWWSEERERTSASVVPPPAVYSLPALPSSACSNDTWTPTSVTTPDPRSQHVAVWTGSEMIYWGGVNGATNVPRNTGGRYIPATDSWATVSTGANVPDARFGHSAAWTGTEMIVWGGQGLTQDSINSGARYNPATNSWLPTSTGANLPLSRYDHTAVWTGSKMIVWGGVHCDHPPPFPCTSLSHENTGGVYDPASDTWTAATSTGTDVPAGRALHTAVWTGSWMVVFGGQSGVAGQILDNGGRYDPSSDTWLPVSRTADVAPGTYEATSVWTGTEVIIWGGHLYDHSTNVGGRYNPATDTWVATSLGPGCPSARYQHTAVWTGSEMIVWGGFAAGTAWTNTGARYDPSNDVWTTTSLGPNDPSTRTWHTSVWTGTEMIVWGGYRSNGTGYEHVNTGGRYCTCPSGPPSVLLGLTEARSGAEVILSWPVVSGATAYDAVKGDLASLRGGHGDFTSAGTTCLADELATLSARDPEALGSGVGRWYLVRAVGCGSPGSYDDGSAAQEGSRDGEILSAGGTCP
jgi:N-acetylneuraminic acid mutarotase